MNRRSDRPLRPPRPTGGRPERPSRPQRAPARQDAPAPSHLTLRNPHSVLAALEARPGDLLDVRIPGEAGAKAWRDVAEHARARGVRVHGLEVDPGRAAERERSGGRAGAEADVRPRKPQALSDLFANAQPGDRWIALDGVQDPHNVGAIFRTAAFFGARGIITTADRAAPLTAVVYDVASGGVETVPHAIETNLRRALDTAKAAGVWVLGTSEHAPKAFGEMPRNRPWLIVLGNEETGLRRLILESCDESCAVPPRGRGVTSLNVSVTAGILLATLAG
ncbi:MAG: RNA methyltransferase [Dehalococcoidia bacterium]|nr:RNA methyltransferase [Dehalococcoidia bacterium]